tara:strand:- start:5545 stop:6450 length:906 start_codon:yes stop_codon:yes gene_type:complete
VPKSRSIQSLQYSFNEDIEHTRKVAKFLSKKFRTKGDLSVSESQMNKKAPIQIRPNKTMINGRSVSLKNKTPDQLNQINRNAEIETALGEMQNLSLEGLRDDQKAIAMLSSIGISTPVNSIQSIKPIRNVSTFPDGQVNPLKKIELDETVGDQEFTKLSKKKRSQVKQNSRLTSMNQSQRDYLMRIAGRMSELHNVGQTGYPNVYSAYRPSMGVTPEAVKQITTGRGRVIGSGATRFIASRAAGINQKVGILSSAGTSELDEMSTTRPDRILSSAGTTSPDELTVDSGPFKPAITSGNTTY